MADYTGFPSANPFKLAPGSSAPAPGSSPYWGPAGYTTPAAGTSKYGVEFGAGQKAQTTAPLQPGAGLWAYNFDPANPNTPYNLYTRIPENNQGDDAGRLQGYFQQYANLKPEQQYLSAYDAFYRDQLTRMATPATSFFDDLGGFLVDNLPSIIGFATGNPWLGAVAGGVQGAVNGDPLGAVTGALGGYGAGTLGAGFNWSDPIGSIGNSLSNTAHDIGGFLQHPLDSLGQAATNVGNQIKDFLPSGTGSQAINSSGLTLDQFNSGVNALDNINGQGGIPFTAPTFSTGTTASQVGNTGPYSLSPQEFNTASHSLNAIDTAGLPSINANGSADVAKKVVGSLFQSALPLAAAPAFASGISSLLSNGQPAAAVQPSPAAPAPPNQVTTPFLPVTQPPQPKLQELGDLQGMTLNSPLHQATWMAQALRNRQPPAGSALNQPNYPGQLLGGY